MNLNEARFRLNKEIPIPLYFQIKQMILGELANGNLKAGDKLPAEMEFCESLQLSRPTVRLALNELVADGILIRHKRSGTFVAEPLIELPVDLGIERLRRHLEATARIPTVEMLELCEVDKIGEINHKLQLETNEKLVYLKRIWRVGEKPIVYTATYLGSSAFHQLLNRDFTELSLYDVLESAMGMQIGSHSVSVKSILASKNDIELLEIERTRASLIYVGELTKDKQGKPVCWSISRYRGDKVYLSEQSEL